MNRLATDPNTTGEEPKKLFPAPPGFAKNAWVKSAPNTSSSTSAPSRTRKASGRDGRGRPRTGPRSGTRSSSGTSTCRSSSGSRAASSTSPTTAWTVTSRPARATRPPSSSRATRATTRDHHLPAAATTRSCEFANVLKKHGVKKGDRVAIYLPMIPELAVACWPAPASARSTCVVFGGFSAEALRDRIEDCRRQGARSPPTAATAAARPSARRPRPTPPSRAPDAVENVIVVKRTDGDVHHEGRPRRLVPRRDRRPGIDADCEPEWMDAEDPLFILYTSGSTGKPKGVLHTTGGYLLFAADTFKYIFDYHDGDVYFVHRRHRLGHRPHLHRLRPAVQRRHQRHVRGRARPTPTRTASGTWSRSTGVNIFYTAPTAIRALMRTRRRVGRQKHDLSSLRLLGSVGEPINPEAWMWYHDIIGEGRCPIVDTWWQTETGGILITPLPGAMTLKPGSATVPFFGVKADRGQRRRQAESAGDEGGNLCIDAAVARHDAHVSRRPRPLQGDLLRAVPGHVLHRRRLPHRRGRLLLDHRPRRRRHQRLRPPHRHRRGRERPGQPPLGRRGRRGRHARTRSRARASTPTSR